MRTGSRWLRVLALATSWGALGTPLVAAHPSVIRHPDAPPPRSVEHDPVPNVTLLTGLNQPILLRGGNAAFSITARSGFSVESSWGIALDYRNLLSDRARRRYASIRSPITGGIGLGYDFLHDDSRHSLAIYLEPKFTMFDVAPRGSAKRFSYVTYTLGPGVYYTVRVWKGLVIQPSVRFWQPIGSSLRGGRHRFVDADGNEAVHRRRAPGFHGVVANISVGWSFAL